MMVALELFIFGKIINSIFPNVLYPVDYQTFIWVDKVLKYLFERFFTPKPKNVVRLKCSL